MPDNNLKTDLSANAQRQVLIYGHRPIQTPLHGSADPAPDPGAYLSESSSADLAFQRQLQARDHELVQAKLSHIGAGGMGEVYRATDTRLGRDVAIKVLPQSFAQDSERMTRFNREAQVLASLNHPNIAQI